MKTLFRVLALGMLLTTLGVVSGFAQEPDLAALFDKFKLERKSPCGQRDAALATGKTIIEKFGDDAENKPVIDYVKKEVAAIEKDDPDCKLADRYNATYKAKNWAEFFSVSKEIMSKQGDSPLGLDVLLTHVSVGYNRTLEKNDAYNNETMSYAKTALQKLEANKPSGGKYGVFEPFKTKDNAQSWMNYILGYYANRTAATDPSKKKEAIAYFYKSTLIGTENKSDVKIYTDIGDYYFNEAASLDEKYRKLREANNNTETDEAKSVLGLARGYADRAIDAFGRARQVATANKATPKTIEAITKRLGELYRFRFNIAATAPTPDLEKYISGLLTKPMPDPSTDVMPVVEEVAPATTTTTSTTTTPATNTATTTTPAKTTTTTKATTTTPAASTATTNKSTTPAKKPVTKKKGTR